MEASKTAFADPSPSRESLQQNPFGQPGQALRREAREISASEQRASREEEERRTSQDAPMPPTIPPPPKDSSCSICTGSSCSVQ